MSQRYFWIFDRTIWDQIRLPVFEWPESFVLTAMVLLFALYLATVVYLDRRFRNKTRFARKLAVLRPRLEAARLSAEERGALRRLAGGRSEARLFRFLSDPVAFESRVHEAMEAEGGQGLRFVQALREELGYRSDNFLVPMVSTRQVRPGDSVRLSMKGEGLTGHHYGRVEAVDDRVFSIRVGEPGLEPQEMAAGTPELFFVRGRDLEYRLPALLAESPADPRRLTFRHALVAREVRPRPTRLPVLAEVEFRERRIHAHTADALEPELAPLPPEKGILNDLNDGGFSLAVRREIVPGRYLEFALPTRRGGRPLRLMGRVTTCRPLPGGLWMAHATLRGLERAKRHLLHQIVMHEQSRRFKALARVPPPREGSPSPPSAAREGAGIEGGPPPAGAAPGSPGPSA